MSKRNARTGKNTTKKVKSASALKAIPILTEQNVFHVICQNIGMKRKNNVKVVLTAPFITHNLRNVFHALPKLLSLLESNACPATSLPTMTKRKSNV